MPVSILTCWLLAPALMVAVMLGCGLVVRRLGGDSVPAVLTLPLGFALTMVIAGTITAFDAISGSVGFVLLVVAIAGYVLEWPRVLAALRRPAVWGWAAAAAFLVFGVVAAPLVLSWTPTWTGYARIVDISHQFELSDYLLESGRTRVEMSDSSSLETIRKVLGSGYPGGWQSALAGFANLLGTDLAFLYQPLVAVTGAVTGIGLFALLRDAIAHPALRALAAGAAAQPNVLYAYGVAGGFKEMTAAALIVTGTALLGSLTRERALVLRDAVPIGVAVAGGLAALSVAILPWLGIILLGFFVLTLLRREVRGRTVLTWASAAAGVVLVSLPLLSEFTKIAKVAANAEGAGRTAIVDLGNLAAPVPVQAVAGTWFTTDYRLPQLTDQPVSDIFVTIVFALALLGVAAELRRRRYTLPLAALAAGIALAYYATRTGPWIELKAICISGPIVLACAFAGGAALVDLVGRWGKPARLLATVVPVGLALAVLTGNAIAYHHASIAPEDRIADLQRIGERYAGQGPAFFNSFDEVAEYFLRDEQATGLVNPPVGREPKARVGAKVKGLQYAWDPDDLRPSYLQSFRLLVARRSPLASRPPSNWELAERTPYHEVWRRVRPASTVIAHVPSSPLETRRPAASCRALTRLAARAAPGSRLAYVESPVVARWVLPRSSSTRSPNWGLGPTPDTLAVSGPGQARASIEVPEAGEYRIWMGGSFGRPFRLSLDGKPLTEVSNRRNYPGQFEPAGQVRVDAGRHRVLASRSGGDLQPGSTTSEQAPIGPLVLVRDRPAPGVVRHAPLSRAGEICRSPRRLDWLEIVAGAGAAGGA